MKRGTSSDSVRIVQIDTHYVETDAVNFRAVVQSLTGKNSPAVWAGSGFLSSSSSSSSLAVAASAAETNVGVEAEAGKTYNYDNNEFDRFHGGAEVEAGKTYNHNDNEVDRFHGGVEAEAGKNYNYNDNEVDRFHGGAVAAVQPDDEGEIKYEEDDYGLSFMKANNLSFKDFDSVWSEFPLMEELP
ncbi:hypothetical protein QN277_005545 [Acacia crassicarpa]|uniref:VQ domain-containing protein n=1 Tax=Acacia crassicarpa TaxID=499986 RepID=A0AAE1JTU5_9FABA|nr:hypothetical protein QN277_005545 [Acacia crassicarpa]